MADDFRLLVGTKIVDNDVQKQLDAMPPKSIKVTPTIGGTKELKKVTDAMGNVYGVTTKYDKVGKELSKTLSSMDEGIVKVSKDLKTVETYTTKHTDSMGRMVTETVKYNKAGEQVGETTRKYSDAIVKAEKHVSSLGEKFVANTKKVAQFAMSTALIGAFTSSIYKAVEAVKEYDDAQTEAFKVSSLTTEGMDAYGKQLGEIGTTVARTRTEMLQASTEFIKSGYTEEQSAQLAKVASLYQNVADSELSAGDASAYVISQMKAFNISAENSMQIIDMTNEVANQFAVSSTDISTALTKSSSAFATYGNSISESIALTTAGSEVMTGQAGKVSRGLRSIGANIVKLADSTGTLEYSVNGVTKSLSLFDEQGKALSTFDVLESVSKDWDKMTQAEQSNLALAQAG